MYCLQEKMIFHPEKLAKDFKYEFNQEFKEWNIKTKNDEEHNEKNFPMFSTERNNLLKVNSNFFFHREYE